MKLNIELYLEDGIYGAYIGEECSSGYDCRGTTKEKCIEQLSGYIENRFQELVQTNVSL